MKKTKLGIFVLLLIAVAFMSGCLAQKSQTQNESPKATEGMAPVPTPAETQNTTVSKLASVETIKCELCHTTAQDLNPHVNGGKLCVTCHGSQVHNIHIGPGTVGLQCDSCHGFPPKVPTIEKGEGPGHYSVCENCHAPPPDSLKPSNGNLIVVHLSRGKYCTNCHGNDIGKTHEAALSKAAKK